MIVELISRKEAKEQGKVKYFTGLLCKNGHVSERYVSTHQCHACITESRPAYVPVVKEEHPRSAAIRENKTTYNTGVPCRKGHLSDRYTSSGFCIECMTAFYNTDEQRIKNKLYREKTKAQKAAYDKEFDKKNKAYRSALKAANRAKRQYRIVSWDKEFTEFVCEEAFHLAELRKDVTGFKWHLDHVIPLCGDKVSGLHVWNNFAVIPASENLSKNNSYTVE